MKKSDTRNTMKGMEEALKKVSDMLMGIDPSSGYPFGIHACTEYPAIPTHTHGLTEVGWPEFIIDPLAFGPKGNAGLINRAYDFFSKPENSEKLKAILKGETVKLTGLELRPDTGAEDPNTYCFREVPPDFEAVRLAYLVEEMGTDLTGMRFVQIFVQGDDFALVDAYYRGGVKW